MRWIVSFALLLLTGCQAAPFPAHVEIASRSIMPLWDRYQQCLATADSALLLQIVNQFESVALTGSDPPSWMKVWGERVGRQPLRTSVDPLALGAACTIRTAMVLSEQHRPEEARRLYRRVLERYTHQEWIYYHDQARDALIALERQDPRVIALITTSLSSQTR